MGTSATVRLIQGVRLIQVSMYYGNPGKIDLIWFEFARGSSYMGSGSASDFFLRSA